MSFVWLQDLVDSHIFLQARSVLEGLGRHDCTAALAWCEEHRARLKRLKSKLEFKLRVQVSPLHFPIDIHYRVGLFIRPSVQPWRGALEYYRAARSAKK